MRVWWQAPSAGIAGGLHSVNETRLGQDLLAEWRRRLRDSL